VRELWVPRDLPQEPIRIAGNFNEQVWGGSAERHHPDGDALLAGSVLAQGVCAYAVVDMATGEATPLPETLTVCGANGIVVGWTALG
jgi:hypothetical protein